VNLLQVLPVVSDRNIEDRLPLAGQRLMRGKRGFPRDLNGN
jgi:hypothetical protein